MLEIKEYKRGNEIYYELISYEKGFENIISKVYFRSVIQEVNGKYWLNLYTSNMVPVSEAFEFLNYTSAHQSINTRTKSMQALKFLYSFCEIIGKNISAFTPTDINNLKLFLKGISFSGKEISMGLLTHRSNRTINGYLAIFRNYLHAIGVKNEALTQTYREGVNKIYDSDPNLRYRSNESTPMQSIEVPRYISPDEFSAILNIIRKKYSRQEECIVRLMYQHGFRLGEVLGLTNDDLVEEIINDGWVTVAYIRNRASDKPYQKAKSCINVIDKKQYRTKDYQEYGFQKVILDQGLYELLNEYICEAHNSEAKDFPENFAKSSIADRVRKNEPFEEKNRYIFISCYGRPLRSDSWNRKLRRIFEEAGIEIDTGVRKHNLNHRFRHGFAMYQVKHMGRNELELMYLMRHSSLKSVEVYFKPTLKDQLELKQAFEESLMTSIPNLMRKEDK